MLDNIKSTWELKTGSKCKIKERSINYSEAQRLVGELCKGKALKEVGLVDGLLKYTQSRVNVPQRKLRPLVLKEIYQSSIAEHNKKNKNIKNWIYTTIEWCQRDIIGRA